MAKYYTLVTDVGRAKMANAQVMGEKVSFSQIALGSSETKPRENQTALGKEEWRGPISNVSLDKDNPNWIVVEAVVPSNVGGFEIAEVGVYDEEGHLIVVGNHPKTYKPKMDEGTTKDVAIRIIIEVSNSEIVELKVDPSVVIATREYVKSAIELAMASIDFSTIEKQIDQHVSNADIHVTAKDKSNWNAKETPSAAQQKATKALEDAKVYTDQQIDAIPEVDTSHLETKEEANKKLEKAKSYTDLHSERTDNPHKVTKSQIGLGNVQNYPVATKDEAKKGLSNTKYMTALRTAEAIKALGASADGVVKSVNAKKPTADGNVDLGELVHSVAGIAPDSTGDVPLTISDLTLDGYKPPTATPNEYEKGITAFRTTLVQSNEWHNALIGGEDNAVRTTVLTIRPHNRYGTTQIAFFYRMGTVSGNSLSVSHVFVRSNYDSNNEVPWTSWRALHTNKSDRTDLDSSDTVATSKAVKYLNDALIGTDDSLRQTQLDVKKAQETADQAFQLGVKQKQATADSLTSIGASLPSDPTWDRLQSEIKKADYVREAQVTISAGQTTATLDFYPTAVSGMGFSLGGNYFCVQDKYRAHLVYREGELAPVASLLPIRKTLELTDPLSDDIELIVTGVAKK